MKTNMITIFALYIHQDIKYLFKNKSKIVPCGGDHNCPICHHNYVYAKHRLVLSEMHPSYASIRLFDNLSNEIKYIETLEKF